MPELDQDQEYKAPTAEEKLARLQGIVKSGDDRRAVHESVENGEEADEETVPMSETAMLRLPETFIIGTAPQPLKLHLRAPVISASASLRSYIRIAFPDVLIGAATADRYGKGIDIAQVAQFWKLRAEKHNREIEEANKRTGSKMKLIPDFTTQELEESVTEELEMFTDHLDGFDYKNSDANDGDGTKHVLNVICDVVWQLAGGDNPGVTRDQLPALLGDRLKAPEFADLLRAIFRCLSGSDVTYESDPYSVFFAS